MRRRYVPLGVGVLVLGAWSVWVSGFHTDSTAAVATWVVSLVAVVGFDSWLAVRRHHGQEGQVWPRGDATPWPRTGRGGARAAITGLAPWLALILIAAVWDVLGIDTGPHEAHLTISALSQAFRPLDAALLLVWMVMGLGFGIARARIPVERPEGAAGQGLLSAAFVLHRPPSSPALFLPSNRPLGVVFWIFVALVGVAVDQLARRSQGRFADAGELLRFASSAMPARVALVIAWTVAGYHLFAR